MEQEQFDKKNHRFRQSVLRFIQQRVFKLYLQSVLQDAGVLDCVHVCWKILAYCVCIVVSLYIGQTLALYYYYISSYRMRI